MSSNAYRGLPLEPLPYESLILLELADDVVDVEEAGGRKGSVSSVSAIVGLFLRILIHV